MRCVGFLFLLLLLLPLTNLYGPQIEGSMSYTLDGKEGVAKPGDKLVIPPGAVHTFWLDADAKEDLVMTATAMGGDKPGFNHRLYVASRSLRTRRRRSTDGPLCLLSSAASATSVRPLALPTHSLSPDTPLVSTNTVGYLSSCIEAHTAPSPFQIFLLLDSANVTLAAPLGLGRLLNLVLGALSCLD